MKCISERIVVVRASFIQHRGGLIQLLELQTQQGFAFQVLEHHIQRVGQVLEGGVYTVTLAQCALAETESDACTGPFSLDLLTHTVMKSGM